MILIKKVSNYNEIQEIKNPYTIQNIYKLVQTPEGEWIFQTCNLIRPGWVYQLIVRSGCVYQLMVRLGLQDWLLGDEKLPSECYYIKPFEWSINMNFDISHLHSPIPICMVLKLKLKLDMLHSDSGKGLYSWLYARHVTDGSSIIDENAIEAYVKEELENRNIGTILHLNNMPKEELQNNTLHYGSEVFRNIFDSWLVVECDVVNATIRGNPMPNVISGEPAPSRCLFVVINKIRLELESKRDVVVGRITPNSDVSVQIPEGCMVKNKEYLNGCISKIHARLEHLGEAVRIKNQAKPPRTYINYVLQDIKERPKLVPEEGVTFAEDVELGFCSDVFWKCRVQKRTNEAGVENISSLVLNYPGYKEVYKIFVWPSCRLKAVDPRLPNWRIAYQNGAHGPEGAFYVTTSDGRSVYLNQQQSIIEDVAVQFVND